MALSNYLTTEYTEKNTGISLRFSVLYLCELCVKFLAFHQPRSQRNNPG